MVIIVDGALWGGVLVDGSGPLMPAGWQDDVNGEFAAAGCEVRMGWSEQPAAVQAAWLQEASCLVLFAHTHVDAAFLDGAPNLVLLSTPGMLTQGGQGGRPAPLGSRLHRIPAHSLLNLHGI